MGSKGNSPGSRGKRFKKKRTAPRCVVPGGESGEFTKKLSKFLSGRRGRGEGRGGIYAGSISKKRTTESKTLVTRTGDNRLKYLE